MANLIDKTFFFGSITVAQISQLSVQDNLELLIAKKEPVYLEGVMGYKTMKDFIAGVALNTPKWMAIKDGAEYTDTQGNLQKWQGLIRPGTAETKVSPIAYFVYYWWLRENASSNTGSGEAVTKTENADVVSPRLKQADAWQEMATMNIELFWFLYSKQEDYPDWKYQDVRNKPDHRQYFNLTAVNLLNI